MTCIRMRTPLQVSSNRIPLKHGDLFLIEITDEWESYGNEREIPLPVLSRGHENRLKWPMTFGSRTVYKT